MKRVVVIILVIIFLFSLSACDKEKNLTKNFIDRWYLSEGTFHIADYWACSRGGAYQNVSIEFFNDGTIEFIGDDENIVGEYSVLDGERIKFNFEGEPIIQEYDFSRHELELYYPYAESGEDENCTFVDSQNDVKDIATEDENDERDNSLNIKIEDNDSETDYNAKYELISLLWYDGELKISCSSPINDKSIQVYLDGEYMGKSDINYEIIGEGISLNIDGSKLTQKPCDLKINIIDADGNISFSKVFSKAMYYDASKDSNLLYAPEELCNSETLLVDFRYSEINLNAINGFPILKNLLVNGYGNTIDLNQISSLENLEYLVIEADEFENTKILSKMIHLETLALMGMCHDLSFLENLNNLKFLGTYIDTPETSFISRLKNIEILSLSLDENIKFDISPFKDLSKLNYLTLFGNLEDISAIKDLTSLEILVLYSYGDDLSDISSIKDLTKLKYLGIYGDYDDISTIENLENIEIISLYGHFKDISPLYSLNNLKYAEIYSDTVESFDSTVLDEMGVKHNLN